MSNDGLYILDESVKHDQSETKGLINSQDFKNNGKVFGNESVVEKNDLQVEKKLDIQSMIPFLKLLGGARKLKQIGSNNSDA